VAININNEWIPERGDLVYIPLRNGITTKAVIVFCNRPTYYAASETNRWCLFVSFLEFIGSASNEGLWRYKNTL
jgi:hypothetical protein